MTPVHADQRPFADLFAGVIEQAVKDLWINEDSRTQSPAESEAQLRARVMELRKARQSAQRYLHQPYIYHAEMLGIESRWVSDTVTTVFTHAREQGIGQFDRDNSEDGFSDPTECPCE